MQRDAARSTYLSSQGLRVLRFSNLDVLRDIEAVVGEIGFAVEARRKSP